MTLYLGIDISKDKFDSFIISEDGKFKQHHQELPNKASGYKALKKWILKEKKSNNFPSIHLGVEASGGYQKPLVDWCRKHTQFVISVINPSQVKHFAKAKLVRTKTDRKDASVIADYMKTMKPDETKPDTKEIEKLRELSRHLGHLKRKRASEKTYLTHVTDKKLQKSIEKIIKVYNKQIKEIEKQIVEFKNKHQEIKEKDELLQSIKGIGEVTSTILIVEIVDSLDPRAQVAHAGISVKHNESGNTKKKPKISKIGNRRLRSALHQATLSAIQFNPIIKKFYHKLLSKGKIKMVAFVACMRKLLHIAIGVLKNKTKFDPNFQNTKQQQQQIVFN